MSNVDDAVMAVGKSSYSLCMGCHGPSGDGVPNVAPPLAGSEWVVGPKENLIKMMFRGLMGPIEVKGEEWNLVMVANAPMLQTDEKIAATLTYIRNSWGNEAEAVTPEEVAAFRGEAGKPMLTVGDLIDPKEAMKADADHGEQDSHGETPDGAKVGHAGEEHATTETVTEEHGTAGADHATPQNPPAASEKTVIAEVGQAPSVELKDYPSGVSPLGIGFGVWLVVCLIPVVIGFAKRNYNE